VPIVLTTTWLALLAGSDPSELPTVTTDRPDQTNGTFTVAPGVWQLETGMDVVPPGRVGDQEPPPLAVPVTLRIGVSERIELRTFDGDPLPWLGTRGRGSPGLALGAKVRLLDFVPGRHRPSLGLQPYISFPSFHPRTWLGTEVGVVGLWAQPIAPWLVLDINASLELGTPGHLKRTLGSLLSASAQITVSHRFVPYAEIYSLVDWRDQADTILAVDAGLVIVVQRRLSFDVAARADVVAARRELGMIAGITVILVDGLAWRDRSMRSGDRRGARASDPRPH
jgi:hypothetical protein